MGGWIAFGLRRGRLTGFDPPTSFEDQASKARPCSTGGGVRVLHHDFEFLSLFYTHLDPDPPVQIHTLLLCGIFYLVAPTRSFFEIQENVRRSFISSLRVAVGTSASRDWIPIEQLNLDVVGAVIGGEREREREAESVSLSRDLLLHSLRTNTTRTSTITLRKKRRRTKRNQSQGGKKGCLQVPQLAATCYLLAPWKMQKQQGTAAVSSTINTVMDAYSVLIWEFTLIACGLRVVWSIWSMGSWTDALQLIH